jgi:hypothetical protein
MMPTRHSKTGADRLESNLQKAAIEEIQARGNMVFRMNSGYSGRRNVKLCPAGTPDLLVICPNGRTVWIELKTLTGTLRQTQRDFHKHLRELGHEVIVVRELKDINAIFP